MGQLSPVAQKPGASLCLPNLPPNSQTRAGPGLHFARRSTQIAGFGSRAKSVGRLMRVQEPAHASLVTDGTASLSHKTRLLAEPD